MRLTNIILSSIALAIYGSALPIPIPGSEATDNIEVPSNLLNKTFNIILPVEKSNTPGPYPNPNPNPSNLLNNTFNIKLPQDVSKKPVSNTADVEFPKNLLNNTFNIKLPTEKQDIEIPKNLLNQTFNIKLPVDTQGSSESESDEHPSNLLNTTFNVDISSENPPNLFNKTFNIKLPTIPIDNHEALDIGANGIYDQHTIYAFYDLRDVGLIENDSSYDISSLKAANETGLSIIQQALASDSYAYGKVRAADAHTSPSIIKIALLNDQNDYLVVNDGISNQENNDEGTPSILSSDGLSIKDKLLNTEGWSRVEIPEVDSYVHATYLVVYNPTQHEIDSVLEHVTIPYVDNP
ncbi:putative secreted protein [Wickerhamomyces ciferrii]|uniref:Secreted protein n=1 Tax=Wickerhamomyces ciferrii (strain ATCC 14091 / BCRC 22168 / CBS 111 / JCM 3599 / NBRC 0793 / NRRL Y-1031 F-60-10) TaxID=1206466 RepID=K0KYY2_WICCF|nr:uncharacterized protein BN7_5870 [Wickerhamomyces ciferrii]CCH46278.1 putative secreted protein [Wickerhamomyces ciferrii]